MCRSDDSVSGQLPNMKLVDCQYPVNVGKQTTLDCVNLYVSGHGLEENQCRISQQRPNGVED